MEEIWKDIEGYEGLYQVSNLGNIRSLDRYSNHIRKGDKKLMKGRVIKPQLNSKGYYSIKLCKDGKSKTREIHRIVAKLFVENIENKPVVNHIDGIKTNNSASNLEWCTQGENIKHAYDIGIHIVTDETRKKISESNKGKLNHMYGKTGEKHHNFGKKSSDETRKKISESNKGKHGGEKNYWFGKNGKEHPASKKVICVTTNEIFECIAQARDKYNICSSTICECCKGKSKSAGKHPITKEKMVWKYL